MFQEIFIFEDKNMLIKEIENLKYQINEKNAREVSLREINENLISTLKNISQVKNSVPIFF